MTQEVPKQEQGEPVAWQGRMDNESEWENLDDEKQAHWRRDSCGYEIRALYTEPQPKAEQEPLARERSIVDLIVAEHGYPKEFKEFEAALKARNNTTSQPDQDEVDIRSRLYQRIHELEDLLRDFARYTGDGPPNMDWQSLVHQISLSARSALGEEI